MSSAEAFRIELVLVDRVRPLRTRYLRSDVPQDEICYECDSDPTTRHFAAITPSGEVVGVATVHLEDRLAGVGPFLSPGMRIRGLAVEDAWRGKGVARSLLDALHDLGRSLGVNEAWGNGRDSNVEFFRRHGYVEVSGSFEVVGQGSHVVFARNLGRLTRAEKTRRKSGDTLSDFPTDGLLGGPADTPDSQP